MDLSFIIQGAVFAELNRHLDNVPSFVRPLLGMMIGAFMMSILNKFTNYIQMKINMIYDKYNDIWTSFFKHHENSILLFYEETKSKEGNMFNSRSTPGFDEVASFLMQRIERAGKCYKNYSYDDSYLARNIKNYRLFEGDDIFIDMETHQSTSEDMILCKSFITIRSKINTISYLHQKIKEIIDEVSLGTHNGDTWTYSMIKHGDDFIDLQKIKNKFEKKWEHLVLSQQLHEILFTYLDRFTKKEWYTLHGIPYKATFLLYGPPGTGKTTIIKTLASQYRRNIVLFSLKGCTSNSFRETFYNYRFRSNMERFIYVFEDIDADTKAVWDRSLLKNEKKKEENKDVVHVGTASKETTESSSSSSSSTELTLATILQTLDGVIETTGLMVIATTNHIERLDPAFIRRFHCRLELSYCSQETTNIITNRFFQQKLSDQEWETHKEILQKKTPNNLIELATCSYSWEIFKQTLLQNNQKN